MKSKVLLAGLVLSTTVPLFAYSLANETCRSANPILSSIDQSKKKDTEDKLCKMDLYTDKYSVCPKLNSTFPGVLVVKRPDTVTDEAFRANYCADLDAAKDKIDAKVVAKLKQTTSCSHVSSGIAYYRVAEFLGGSRVPVTVFRTMDKQKHLAVAQQAQKILQGKTELIAQTWARFIKMHADPKTYPEVFGSHGTVVRSALSENITGEFKYTEVSGVGSYDTRYQRFLQQAPFLRVANGANITTLAGGTELKNLAPIVTQMKDVSNMIIIDHMLNQADRIGNIHFKYKWYKYDQGQIIESKSEAEYLNRKDVVPAEELARAQAGEVLVKEMILKDNDCGISKSNEMKKLGAVAKIRHMSPSVYQQVQKLAAFVSAKDGSGVNYFKKELELDSAYILGNKYHSGIKTNIEEVARTLKANCESGALSLDLDLEQLMVNPNFKASCSVQ